VAIGANFYVNIAGRRACLYHLSAGASYRRNSVFWMNSLFHMIYL